MIIEEKYASTSNYLLAKVTNRDETSFAIIEAKEFDNKEGSKTYEIYDVEYFDRFDEAEKIFLQECY